MITSEHIQHSINYKITNDLSPTSVRNIVVLLERSSLWRRRNLLPVTKPFFHFSEKFLFYINDT